MMSVRLLAYRAVSPLIDRLNLTLITMRDGKVIRIPTLGRIGYRLLLVEDPWMSELLKRLFSLKDGVFVDVGVNLGQTLIKVKCVSAGVEYVGFEPNPVCVDYARRLIHRNRFGACEVVSAGLSNDNGIASLVSYDSETASGATTVTDLRAKEVKHRFSAPFVRLDYACDKLNLGKLSVVKIDVEGAELEVLQGMVPLLEKERPFILCEVLPAGSSESRRVRQEEVVRLLKSHDYFMCRIDKGNRGHLVRLTCIETLPMDTEWAHWDYLFTPNELLDLVVE